ncbi:transmembrane protein 272-like [Dicentrarchus labrax]|uniref:transmembrane protein 272-like n=1 Tax=Dicentrarchus labrax TaxID=13489 RepID=UPI0021F53155|nr:transmembrane protein 272-like [Dicentrarchus labrax]XP_051284816.1 transmembrane protein 272-like [Dicentrarchus labrax]
MSESGRPIRTLPKPPVVILVCIQLFMTGMAFAQLVIGAMYQFDCPRQRYIPVYLLVMGVITLLLVALNLLPCTAAGFGNNSELWSALVSLFFVCWFIAGNVWIYSIYEHDYNKMTEDVGGYCNKTLYLFAFWTINVHYILLGLLILSTCYSYFLYGGNFKKTTTEQTFRVVGFNDQT